LGNKSSLDVPQRLHGTEPTGSVCNAGQHRASPVCAEHGTSKRHDLKMKMALVLAVSGGTGDRGRAVLGRARPLYHCRFGILAATMFCVSDTTSDIICPSFSDGLTLGTSEL
jgi:hypothetical protein